MVAQQKYLNSTLKLGLQSKSPTAQVIFVTRAQHVPNRSAQTVTCPIHRLLPPPSRFSNIVFNLVSVATDPVSPRLR